MLLQVPHALLHQSRATCALNHIRNCGLNGHVGSLHHANVSARRVTQPARAACHLQLPPAELIVHSPLIAKLLQLAGGSLHT